MREVLLRPCRVSERGPLELARSNLCEDARDSARQGGTDRRRQLTRRSRVHPETHLLVSIPKTGKPFTVLNAGSRSVASSSALCNSISSPDRACAASRPPKYRITVSKKGAKRTVPPFLELLSYGGGQYKYIVNQDGHPVWHS